MIMSWNVQFDIGKYFRPWCTTCAVDLHKVHHMRRCAFHGTLYSPLREDMNSDPSEGDEESEEEADRTANSEQRQIWLEDLVRESKRLAMDW